MWDKKNNATKGKFEFDLSAERMKDFSAVKAQKSEPSKLAKGLLGLCALIASANNSTENEYTSAPIYDPDYDDPFNPSSMAFDPTDPIFGKFDDYGNPIE
ncbi:hypothetical protein [Actinobacillus porcinus]|uniref:hypothetical protein n=1 Tax=Actinobacillus porcinus TaxID=51048 RepID=UPI002A9170B8|nr:hypothetical protein [Actinobacillus porcinus]MDY6216080.1 hypothetical protein [Actinobacillus porcinus]